MDPRDDGQLYSLMIESARLLIAHYARQIPGSSTDRQVVLTRAMRRVRDQRAQVVSFDRIMVRTYLDRFREELVAAQRH